MEENNKLRNVDEQLNRKILREGWTLRERIKHAQLNNSCKKSQTDQAKDIDLTRWEAAVSLESKADFDKRLEWDGLTRKDAAWILEPDEIDIPDNPYWWEMLQRIRAAARTQEISTALEHRCNEQAFVDAWRRPTAWALETLRRRCNDLIDCQQISESAWQDIAESLLHRLCTTTGQAMWELFNKQRTPKIMMEAYFSIDERTNAPTRGLYDRFIAELLETGYRSLLTSYPVLGRLLAIVTEMWLKNSEEMLRRVTESRKEIAAEFSIATQATLAMVNHSLSDPHRGGKSVAILTFKNDEGEEQKLLYKPKNMQIDRNYQIFLQKLNEESTLPPLRHLTVVSNGEYGFMEWVEHRQSHSEKEMGDFYFNAGRMIAVLHLLGCTDCHHENLIASGDQLVLIDTETLFEVELVDNTNPEMTDTSAMKDAIQRSVLRSGLLPRWIMFSGGYRRRFDISALGINPPPKELELPSWIGLNTDGMMPGRSVRPCELPTSLPVELGGKQRLVDFSSELCAGFVAQLSESIRLRSLIRESYNHFRMNTRRLVLRNTVYYVRLQRKLLEPKYLASAVDQGLVLEGMGRLVVQPNDEFNSWSIQKDEARQMQQLDIPYFEHHVDSTTVALTGEQEMVSDLIKTSGMVSAVKRLELLKTKEIEAQERFLIGTIKARSLEHQSARSLYLASGSNECDSRVSGDRTTNAIETCDAMQLYKDVWNEAICDEKGRPEWLGVDAMGNCESFQYGLLGDSLFSGITGIALAMARITLDNADPQTGIWKDRARACIDKFSSQIEQRRGEKYRYFVDGMPVGMLGKGGILLALGLLSQAGIGESEQVVDTLVERIKPDDIRSDVCLDLLGGIAGLIGPMLLLGTERCIELAIICGERLLELQHENGSWETVDMPTRITAKDLLGPCPLAEGGRLLKKDSSGTNFCSGSSGIAAGLARLGNSTGHEPFTAGALRAVEYERKHISIKSIKDMKDKASDDEDCWEKWGEGASGVALSRLVLQSVGLGNEDIGIELDHSRRELKEQLKRSLKRTGFNNGLGWGAVGHASVLGLEMGLNQQRCHKDEEDCFASLRANKDNIVNSQEKDMSMLHGLFTGRAGTAFLLFEASTEMRWLPQIMTAGLYKSA